MDITRRPFSNSHVIFVFGRPARTRKRLNYFSPWICFCRIVGNRIVLLIWPTDELALDKDNIYFIRKSLWSELNRTRQYKISNFKTIGTYNMSKPAGVFALFVPVWDVHRVEMIFKDDSSSSLDLMIPKKELKKILLMVREKIIQNR